MASRYKAAIFDMDGTLLDSMTEWRKQNRAFLTRRGLAVPAELEDTIDYLSGHRCALEMIERFHLPISGEDGLFEFEFELIEKYRDVIRPKRGARAYLEALRQAGIVTCVATATPKEIAREALRRHGLDSFMAFITDMEEVGFSKADPACYDVLAERLQLDKGEIIMVEDALYAMQGAKKAGLCVYGIEEKITLPFPALVADIRAVCDRYVHDFTELL